MNYNINKNIQTYYPKEQSLNNKTTFANVFTDDSGGAKRYFSGIDAEIYFDDIFIDDVIRIKFKVEQVSNIIYGYNSYVYDSIMLGARLVTGEFEINFTKGAYLYEVLSSLNGASSKVTYNSKRAPIWNKSFDIYVSYGDARQTNYAEGSTVLLLKDIHIISSEQEFDASGKPVTEKYMFLAKDIEYVTSEVTAVATTTSTVTVATDALAITSAIVRVDGANVYLDMTIGKDYDVTAIMYKASKDQAYEAATFKSGTKTVSTAITGANALAAISQLKTSDYVNIFYMLDYSDGTVASKSEQTIKAYKGDN